MVFPSMYVHAWSQSACSDLTAKFFSSQRLWFSSWTNDSESITCEIFQIFPPYFYFKSLRINSLDTYFSLARKLIWTSMCECWRSTVYSGFWRQLPNYVKRSIWYFSWVSLASEESISLMSCSKHLKLLDSIVESMPSGLIRFSYVFSPRLFGKFYCCGGAFSVSNNRLLMPTSLRGCSSAPDGADISWSLDSFFRSDEWLSEFCN